MTEEKKVTNQEYWQGFPEAPASDTFKWIDGEGFEHMTTIRAWNGGNLYKSVAEFVAHIKETGGKNLIPPIAPAPLTVTPQVKITQEPETGGMSLNIAKIKVTPEVKDGKPRIMVELFEANHQWADIKAFYNDATQAAAAFGEVTGLDFSVAGEYSLNCIADYRNSEKKNSKGNPYKNLVNIRA